MKSCAHWFTQLKVWKSAHSVRESCPKWQEMECLFQALDGLLWLTFFVLQSSAWLWLEGTASQQWQVNLKIHWCKHVQQSDWLQKRASLNRFEVYVSSKCLQPIPSPANSLLGAAPWSFAPKNCPPGTASAEGLGALARWCTKWSRSWWLQDEFVVFQIFESRGLKISR